MILVLLTLFVLDPERGVMFGLRMLLFGVPSSLGGEAIPISGRVARLSSGVDAFEGVVPATLGVRGVVIPPLRLEWLRVGARVLRVVGLSYGIALPALGAGSR